jgi:hypothetical protein
MPVRCVLLTWRPVEACPGARTSRCISKAFFRLLLSRAHRALADLPDRVIKGARRLRWLSITHIPRTLA